MIPPSIVFCECVGLAVEVYVDVAALVVFQRDLKMLVELLTLAPFIVLTVELADDIGRFLKIFHCPTERDHVVAGSTALRDHVDRSPLDLVWHEFAKTIGVCVLAMRCEDSGRDAVWVMTVDFRWLAGRRILGLHIPVVVERCEPDFLADK
jgi:hypothetical protein